MDEQVEKYLNYIAEENAVDGLDLEELLALQSKSLDSMIKKSLQNAAVSYLEMDEIPGSDMPSPIPADAIKDEQAYKDILKADCVGDALRLCGDVYSEWGDPYDRGYGWSLVIAMAHTIDNMSVWTKEEA